MTTDSWTFCHRCARMIWISEIFSVGICTQHTDMSQQPIPSATFVLRQHNRFAMQRQQVHCNPATDEHRQGVTLPCMKMPVRSS